MMSGRQRWLIGTLSLTLVSFAFDALTRGPGPKAAQARPSANAAAPGSNDAAGDALMTSEKLAALLREITSPLPSVLPDEQSWRDPFAMTEVLKNRLGVDDPVESPAEDVAPPPPPTVGFAARHALRGVITGERPMAILDGKVVRLGDELDGLRLIEVHRMHVVFSDGAERVILRVTAGGGS